MDRALARVVKIDSVIKHPNADRLAIAKIGGWNVIVSLDTSPRDVGVYFEIDSVLPDTDWVTTLNLKSKTIKSMKIRNVLSQGLFLPLGQLEGCLPQQSEDDLLKKKDVTEDLGVTKRPDTADREVIESTSISFATLFPSGPCKTDEPRVQNSSYLLEQLQGKPYYISVKYDGTSGTFGFDASEKRLKVCSRNLSASLDSVYWEMARKYHLENKLSVYPSLVFQGEVYGPKIQKNRLQVKDNCLTIFNVFDQESQKYLDFSDLREKCRQLDLPLVEVLEAGDSFAYSTEELLEKSRGQYRGTRNHREGIVVRSLKEIMTEKERLSFKVINNDYLLSTGQ